MSSVTVSLDKLGKALENQIKKDMKQVRFAAMNAVNDVAFQKVRPKLVEEYGKSFTVRNKSFPKAVQIKKATKTNLVADVSYKADFMKLHTTGGEKHPDKAKALSVPIDKDADGLRFSNGRVKGRNKAFALLKYANENPIKIKGKSAVKRAFVLKKGNVAVVVKREKGTTTTKSRFRDNGDKILFAFSKKAKIKQRWDFDKIVSDVAQKELGKAFEKRLAEAIRTEK